MLNLWMVPSIYVMVIYVLIQVEVIIGKKIKITGV